MQKKVKKLCHLAIAALLLISFSADAQTLVEYECDPETGICDSDGGGVLYEVEISGWHDCDAPIYWRQLEDPNNDGIPDGCLRRPGNESNNCDHRYSPNHNQRRHCIGGGCCDGDGPWICVPGLDNDDAMGTVMCPHPVTGIPTAKTVAIFNCVHTLKGEPSGLYCFGDANANGKVDGGETVYARGTCAEVTW